ncbi:MAG: arginine--tRNA ligase [Bacteroidota bacterium]
MISKLFSDIQRAAADAVKTQYDIDIDPSILSVQETRKEFEGDYTLVVFPLAKFKLGAPPVIGETLGKFLIEKLDFVDSYNVIKGFLNLKMTDAFWGSFLAHAAEGDAFLRREEGKGQKVVVEYCSPNTNKPLHLGHLRNIVLGASITEILKANGYQVHPVCLFNDRGTAISKSMHAWMVAGKEDTPESTGIKGDLLVGNYYVEYAKLNDIEIQQLIEEGVKEVEAKKKAPSSLAVQEILIKWENGDKEIRALWENMNSWVYKAYHHTFKRLGISFEKLYYESQLYQLGKEAVMKGLESGAFYKKDDGSVWVDLTDEGLDHKLLLRSNGTSVYITQDIATADVRFQDYGMDRSVYVVGNEQDYHFKVLFLILKKLGYSFSEGLHHLSYGMVDLPTGKMKSREGKAVDADDLLDQMEQTAKEVTEELGKTEGMDEEALGTLYQNIALSALKYFLVKVDPQKRMLFDPNESVDIQGHTGPFIQYAYTRTASIKRKAETVAPFKDNLPLELPLQENERFLLRRLANYPEVLQEAADQYTPSLIANYAYELAKDYNRFYHGDKILHSAHPATSAFRFTLSNFAGSIMKEAMRLLGISMPERM